MMNRPLWRPALVFAALWSALVAFHGPLPAEEPGTAKEKERAEADAQQAARVEFFEAKIRPVLVEHCYSCHAAKADTVQGGLRVDSRAALRAGGDSGPAVVPGKPDESLLMAALRFEGPEMPPKGQLPERVVADFERWIRDGAVDPRKEPAGVVQKPVVDFAEAAEFWAFQTPRRHEPPTLADSTGVRGELDRFVREQLETAGLRPAPPASPRVLMRRAYFGLIGLPPTPQQVQTFLEAWERDPEAAYDQLVDQLLQSPHYGERWARHWLDVARYGEDQAHTFKARNYPRGYLYRDWVVRSLNEDLPYDQFIAQQIAGDLLPGPDRHERLAALGLFALGPVYYAENVEQAKARADEWDDRVDTLMRGVLGLTVSCARCHDHKYDPITMKDYYGLAGIFAGTKYEQRPIVSEDVVRRRREADAAVNRQQLAVERFLAEEARRLRPTLVADIPRYLQAAAGVLLEENRKDPGDGKKGNAKQAQAERKKRLEQQAKEHQVSAELLGRWVDYLESLRGKPAEELGDWRPLAEVLELCQAAAPASGGADEKAGEEAPSQEAPAPKIPAQKTLSQEDLNERVAAIGQTLRETIEAKLPRREDLFRRFGANVAFVEEADLAEVRPGVIPLGNLFDDSAQVPLDAALATDRYQAQATADSLGVDRVAQGWGARTEIAPGIKFDFARLGSDDRAYGAVVNDAWNNGGAIRTQGQRGGSAKRLEQGIGMHANALITFDLAEIRRAGLLAEDQRLVFRVDRAGLNDDVFGTGGASAHLAVILSRPHKDKAVTDAILAGYVNGQRQDIATDDFTYYFSGNVPESLGADGQYVAFDIPIPPEARYLTLVAAGAGKPEDNSISSDHTVFSGARLELDPLPREAVAEKGSEPADGEGASGEADRRDALLLSRLFYDEGLLALSPKEAEPRLASEAAEELKQERAELNRLRKEAASIEVTLAHSLTEGSPTDLPVYIQGNPAKHGEQAPRAMPVIFTDGERQPFEGDGSGRLQLARAIASPDNPLVARVIVNRVWAGHFGHGLVRTPSNFGKLGERPTHPQLLDWLAVRFIEEGWSLKWLHREIMRSATYRQSSAFDARNFEADPENRLLWRMNRRRLEIEPWRDSLLAVTGELDTTLGGPSRDLADANNKRRTLYGFVSRHKLNELLRLFDFPDPNITAGKRSVTTVPLQQLFVLNSDFMIQRSRALAARLRERSGGEEREAVNYAYRLLYARPPSAAEWELGTDFLTLPVESDEGSDLDRWEQYALALLSANELLYLD